METVVRNIFQLKSEKLIRSIVKTISLVIFNIKSTWLIDSFKCSVEQLTRLIQELNLETQLCGIHVCEDIFLANREGLLHLVTTKNVSDILVTDVTPKLDIPRLIRTSDPSYHLITEHINRINEEIRNFLTNSLQIGIVLRLSIEEFPLELTFVFGWLLCYPFIYFNSNYMDTEVNNLTNIPLKLTQVLIEGVNILSFSVPLMVLEETGMSAVDLLAGFKRDLEDKTKKTPYQDTTLIQENTLTLNYVVL